MVPTRPPASDCPRRVTAIVTRRGADCKLIIHTIKQSIVRLMKSEVPERQDKMRIAEVSSWGIMLKINQKDSENVISGQITRRLNDVIKHIDDSTLTCYFRQPPQLGCLGRSAMRWARLTATRSCVGETGSTAATCGAVRDGYDDAGLAPSRAPGGLRRCR